MTRHSTKPSEILQNLQFRKYYGITVARDRTNELLLLLIAIAVDDDEVPAQCNIAQFESCGVFGRLIPGLRLLNARKLDNHYLLGLPLPFQNANVTIAGKILPAILSDRLRGAGAIYLERFLIANDQIGNHDCGHGKSPWILEKHQKCDIYLDAISRFSRSAIPPSERIVDFPHQAPGRLGFIHGGWVGPEGVGQKRVRLVATFS
jgi:hypothetical protein